MARSKHKDKSIHQKNNSSCLVGNKNKKAKRNSNKRDRQLLQKELKCIDNV